MEHALAAYFVRRADVRLALLFGSHARGDARPGSDVDGAVQFEAAADLTRLCRRTVDVVDIATAPPVLSFAIAGEGRLLRRVREQYLLEDILGR